MKTEDLLVLWHFSTLSRCPFFGTILVSLSRCPFFGTMLALSICIILWFDAYMPTCTYVL